MWYKQLPLRTVHTITQVSCTSSPRHACMIDCPVEWLAMAIAPRDVVPITFGTGGGAVFFHRRNAVDVVGQRQDGVSWEKYHLTLSEEAMG